MKSENKVDIQNKKIFEIFTAHGFQPKTHNESGEPDFHPYVYEAANALAKYILMKIPSPSPCVAICSTTFDEICSGCGRTFMEVANWVSMSEDEKNVVLARIKSEGYPKREIKGLTHLSTTKGK